MWENNVRAHFSRRPFKESVTYLHGLTHLSLAKFCQVCPCFSHIPRVLLHPRVLPRHSSYTWASLFLTCPITIFTISKLNCIVSHTFYLPAVKTSFATELFTDKTRFLAHDFHPQKRGRCSFAGVFQAEDVGKREAPIGCWQAPANTLTC